MSNKITAAQDVLAPVAYSLHSISELLDAYMTANKPAGEPCYDDMNAPLWALMEAADANAERVRKAITLLDEALDKEGGARPPVLAP